MLPPVASELAIVRLFRGVHLLIQRCEKQVLEDCLVVCAFFCIEVCNQFREVVFIKERVRHKVFLLEKPDEDEPRNQADDAGRVADGFVVTRIRWKRHPFYRPEIPIGDLFEKTSVEFGGVQRLLPRLMEFQEIGEPVLMIERIKRQLRQDVKVCAVRIVDVNIFDKRYLFQDIPVAIALTRSAADNREGEGVSMLKNQQCGDGVEFIDFAGDVGECGAGICPFFKFDSEKQVGLINTLVNAWILIESERLLRVLSDFVSSELEKEVGGVPFVEVCFLWIYEVVRVKIFAKCLGCVGVAVECALTLIA